MACFLINKTVKAVLCTAFIICNAHASDNVIWYHYGNEELEMIDLQNTVDFTISKFDNIKNKDIYSSLVFETIIVETRAGGASYTYAAENWNNFGIAQIRSDTSEYLLTVLKKYDLQAYRTIMTLRDESLSEKDNLLYNVPYSVAVCAQYYNLRLNGTKGLNDADNFDDLKTLDTRARVWKKQYNTSKGVGSVSGYVKRVYDYYKRKQTNVLCNNV